MRLHFFYFVLLIYSLVNSCDNGIKHKKDEDVKETSFSTSLHNSHDEVSQNKQVQRLIYEFGELLIIKSFAAIEAYHFLINDSLIEQQPNLNSINNLKKHEQLEILQNFNNYIENINFPEQKVITKHIANWCNGYRILKGLFFINTRTLVNFNQVFYENQITRQLFEKYLTNKNQYWGSLTLTQSSLLFLDILNHVSILSTDEQLFFYANIYEQALEKSNEQ